MGHDAADPAYQQSERGSVELLLSDLRLANDIAAELVAELETVKSAFAAYRANANGACEAVIAERDRLTASLATTTALLKKQTEEAHKEAMELHDRCNLLHNENMKLGERLAFQKTTSATLLAKIRHRARIITLLQLALDNPELMKGIHYA